MARSITTRSTNPKIMDDNIKILDDSLAVVSTPPAEDVVYDNTDSGLTATDVQAAIDELATGKISLGETSVYTKSSEVTGGNYPTGKNFFAIIVQSGGNGAVTTNLLNSAYLNKRVYVDTTHFAYFNNSGVFSMSDLQDGDLVAIIPIN